MGAGRCSRNRPPDAHGGDLCSPSAGSVPSGVFTATPQASQWLSQPGPTAPGPGPTDSGGRGFLHENIRDRCQLDAPRGDLSCTSSVLLHSEMAGRRRLRGARCAGGLWGGSTVGWGALGSTVHWEALGREHGQLGGSGEHGGLCRPGRDDQQPQPRGSGQLPPASHEGGVQGTRKRPDRPALRVAWSLPYLPRGQPCPFPPRPSPQAGAVGNLRVSGSVGPGRHPGFTR